MSEHYSDMGGSPFDRAWFRQVLGQYPTGVCVVTAVMSSGDRGGMVVGSFTSVSLDPPMIAFFPSSTSQTWPELRDSERFCVNVLAADQEWVARQFAMAPMEARFDGVATRSTPSGAPLVDGAVAWIECSAALVQEAGDHFLVLGDVTALGIENGKLPLLFFRGGYGRFSPLSFVASDRDGSLVRQLRHLDLIRPVLRRVPDSGLRCLVTTRVADRVVPVGRFEPPAPEGTPESSTLVGSELPSHPEGLSIFLAWDAEECDVDTAAQRGRIRERGYSIGLAGEAERRRGPVPEPFADLLPAHQLGDAMTVLDYDPPEITDRTLRAARLVSVPVFDGNGGVDLVITVWGFRQDPEAVRAVIRTAQVYGEEASRLVQGQSLART